MRNHVTKPKIIRRLPILQVTALVSQTWVDNLTASSELNVRHGSITFLPITINLQLHTVHYIYRIQLQLQLHYYKQLLWGQLDFSVWLVKLLCTRICATLGCNCHAPQNAAYGFVKCFSAAVRDVGGHTKTPSDDLGTVTEATAIADAGLDDKFTKCPHCVHLFADPKLLPCLHTICLCCLEKFPASAAQVTCPCCCRPFPVPVGGVGLLPANRFFARLADERRRKMTGVDTTDQSRDSVVHTICDL